MNVGTLDFASANLALSAPQLPTTVQRDIDASAREFEAVFIAQMLEQMWAEVPTDGPMGGGTGERIFRSLMIQDVGRQIANQGGLGLADKVKRELLALQEANSK